MTPSSDFSDKQAGQVDKKIDDGRTYEPPKHSPAFLEHLNEVKNAWPSEQSSDDEIRNENKNMQSDSTGYGVFCTGEPAIDPSRQVQSVFDGDSDWI